VEAVGRELAGRDVITQVASFRGFRDQLCDELMQLLVGSDDMVAAMQQSGEFRVVVAVRHLGEAV
jgi:hypothetical protein